MGQFDYICLTHLAIFVLHTMISSEPDKPVMDNIINIQNHLIGYKDDMHQSRHESHPFSRLVPQAWVEKDCN